LQTVTRTRERGLERSNDTRGETRRALGELLAAAGLSHDGGSAALDVTSIAYDSREVEPGALFVAVRGFTVDGHDYVADAARRGAVAALVESPTGSAKIAELVVGDTRAALGLVAHEFYGHPADRLKVHGVTGTNGKTTTTYLIDSIMREAGRTTGVVGTLGYRVGARDVAGDRTSPESLDLARLLSEMVDEGVGSVVMEVSSHALSLGRVTGVRFATATLTNLSRDHLDFHGSLEEYRRVKRSFFELMEGEVGKRGAAVVLNADDELGRELAGRMRSAGSVRVITYGTSDADIVAEDVESSPSGTTAVFRTPEGSVPVRLRLVSSFNVQNALAAMGVAVSQSVPLEVASAGLGRVASVPGRLEPVDAGQRFAIVVDYAHTPDALEKVLGAVRGLRPERLITVFGCGGDRDRGKRPIMGEIAVRNSDVVIVTSDNPRTEDPEAIIGDVLSGLGDDGLGAHVDVIVDRREAIARAVSVAAPGDVVLIAGKGHEDYQIVGTEKRHFDDREEAARAVRRLRSS